MAVLAPPLHPSFFEQAARRLIVRARRGLWAGLLLSAVFGAGDGLAAGPLTAMVVSKDGLGVANHSVTIEAKLFSKGLLTQTGLGGEPLELVIGGRVVATAMTGGDGKAFFSYRPMAQGIVPMQVRVGNSPRVAPAEGTANLAVWERRSPILAVELAALVEDPSGQGPFPVFSSGGAQPMPQAAEELGKLTQFYYRVIYVVTTPPGGSDGFQIGAEAREWLKAHQFPTGYVLALPPHQAALGEKIDELHAAGWTTIRTGIGRTKPFAETFLQRRLEAFMVPAPKKGEAPRKAKIATDWKDVRKQVQ